MLYFGHQAGNTACDTEQQVSMLQEPKEAVMGKEFFAVFVVAPVGDGIAATTRAADKGEAGRIGLPGGKVDAGETPQDAALRESAEEGWAVKGLSKKPFHQAMVEGKLVAWFAAKSAKKLAGHKEAGRVEPVLASEKAVAESGYGNDAAMAAYALYKAQVAAHAAWVAKPSAATEAALSAAGRALAAFKKDAEAAELRIRGEMLAEKAAILAERKAAQAKIAAADKARDLLEWAEDVHSEAFGYPRCGEGWGATARERKAHGILVRHGWSDLELG